MSRSILIGSLLTCLLAAGCGDSDDGNVNSGPAATQTLSGMIRSEAGVGLSGVRVVVEERTTNAKVAGMTASDGSYQLQVPRGVYDLGLDREQDMDTATCFYGPLTLSSDLHRDFVLKSSTGMDASRIFGIISLQAGRPAANRKVRLRPAFVASGDSDDPVPPDVESTTDASGAFDLLVGSSAEVGLDLEVYEANGDLDEFIDIAKRDKPCYVEFATEESAVEDAYRVDETAAPPRDSNDKLTNRFTIQTTGTRRFNGADFIESVDLVNGTVPSNFREYNWGNAVVMIPSGREAYFLREVLTGYVRTGGDGDWWYDHQIHVNVGRPCKIVFHDASGDSYTLRIFSTFLKGHQLNYNSPRPEITKIELYFDFT